MNPTLPFLTMADVAALLGVRPKTVGQILFRSKPGNMYASRPFPAPIHNGNRPIWVPAPGETMDQLRGRIVAWKTETSGAGPRAGRKPGKPQTVRRLGLREHAELLRLLQHDQTREQVADRLGLTYRGVTGRITALRTFLDAVRQDPDSILGNYPPGDPDVLAVTAAAQESEVGDTAV